MKKQTVLILTVILNLTIFTIFGFGQDAYFDQQIRKTKPASQPAKNTPATVGVAPANDNLANAENIVLSSGSAALLKSNIDATKEANEPDHAENTGGKSVWFTLTPAQTQVFRLETGHPVTNFDTTLAVYKGTAFGNFARVGYSDDCLSAGCGVSSKVELKLEAGTTYRIAVDGFGAGPEVASGTFVLTVTALSVAVAHDNIGAFYDLGTTVAGSVASTNHFATGEGGEPGAYGDFGGKSVWFRYKVTTRRAMAFEISADFSAEIAVYMSSNPNPTFGQLIRVNETANNFGFNYDKNIVNFTGQTFQTYYFIQVDYHGVPQAGETGNFQLKFYQAKMRYSSRVYNQAQITAPIVYRPADNIWYDHRYAFGTPSGADYTKFGKTGDTPVSADFDGDGLTNYAVTRNQNGQKYWYILSQHDYPFYTFKPWGLATDKEIVGDFDHDGIADPTVIRNVNGQLVWYVYKSTDSGMKTFIYGINNDRPVVGDFDGDGETDVAVVRETGGNLVWWILYSGQNTYSDSFTQQFGLATDRPVAEDFDGDGKTDIAVYRPSNGTWYIQRSKTGELQTTPFGIAIDNPQPADYDGDGKADLAVFRPTTGEWFFWFSYTNTQKTFHWGTPGDIAVASMSRFSMPESNE